MSGGSEDRSQRAGVERPGGLHQPGGQGRQGRTAVLVHRARRRGRRPRSRRRRPRQGPRGPGGDPQGGRARQEGSDLRPAQDTTIPCEITGHFGAGPGVPQAGGAGHGVIAGRRGAGRAGGGRGAGHPDQDAGHATIRTTCSRRPSMRCGGSSGFKICTRARRRGGDSNWWRRPPVPSKKLKITLTQSMIGLSPKQEATVKALGLRRMRQPGVPRRHPDDPRHDRQGRRTCLDGDRDEA